MDRYGPDKTYDIIIVYYGEQIYRLRMTVLVLKYSCDNAEK